MNVRSERTRRRIVEVALSLFQTQGYDATPVTQIAEEAGVSHMTFFRHFPSKSDVVVSDPYDPVIAELVAAQPVGLPPLERGRRGFVQAWASVTSEREILDDTVRARLSIVAEHPGLRARMWESQLATQQAVAAALRDGGTEPLEAEAAAGALVGALTAALLWLAAEPHLGVGDVVMRALDTLVVTGEGPGHGAATEDPS